MALARSGRLLQTLLLLALWGLVPSAALAAPLQMYWTNGTADAIQRAGLDGTAITTVIPGITALSVAIDLAGGKLYWTQLGNVNISGDESIRRANLDGSLIEVLADNADGLSSPGDIELDLVAGKMYWVDGGLPAARIVRANLDGTAVEVVFNVLDHRAVNFGSGSGQTLEFAAVWGLALDTVAGDMYWTDFSGGDIHRAKLDGSGVSGPLVTGIGTPRGIALDAAGGLMYWAATFDSTISRAALDGSNIQVVASDVQGVAEPFGIAIDPLPGKLYWTNIGSGVIQRADLNGQNVESLVVLANEDLFDVAIPILPRPRAVPALTMLGQLLLAFLLLAWAMHTLGRQSVHALSRSPRESREPRG